MGIIPFPSVSSALSCSLVSVNHRSSRATKVPPPWHRDPHPRPLSCLFTDPLPEPPHTYLSSPGSRIHVLVPEALRLLLPGLSAKLVNSTHWSRPRSGFRSPPGGDQPHDGLPAPETWKTRLRTSPLLGPRALTNFKGGLHIPDPSFQVPLNSVDLMTQPGWKVSRGFNNHLIIL